MIETARLRLRPLDPLDGPALLAYKASNLEFFQPWWPSQDTARYTLREQLRVIEGWASDWDADRRYALGVFLPGEDGLVGQVNLNNVVRGAFHSADVGYSIAPRWNGRGFMTEALGGVIGWARTAIGLHRLQAAVMPRNHASLAVLRHHQFDEIGLAARYLAINGVWEDHRLFQRLLE